LASGPHRLVNNTYRLVGSCDMFDLICSRACGVLEYSSRLPQK
jgi:hypothetical protein